MKSSRSSWAKRVIIWPHISGTLKSGRPSKRLHFQADHLIQESYFTYSENEEPIVDPNVHFRPGIATDGSETFTPRTVIYDLKGGFGTLRKYNALYGSDESAEIQGLW
jgi:hypothetical protein